METPRSKNGQEKEVDVLLEKILDMVVDAMDPGPWAPCSGLPECVMINVASVSAWRQ